jgi:hypothetical protein
VATTGAPPLALNTDNYAANHAPEVAAAAADELWRGLLGPDADTLETITRGPLPSAGEDTYIDVRRL